MKLISTIPQFVSTDKSGTTKDEVTIWASNEGYLNVGGVFDNNDNTQWRTGASYSGNGHKQWIKIQFSTKKSIVKCIIKTVDDKWRRPKNLRIEASDTGTFNGEQIKLYEIKTIDWDSLGMKLEFSFDNPDKYLYYRLFINDYGDAMFRDEISLTTFEMYELITENKFLIKQNNQYHTTKSNLQPLGQPNDNTQLKDWYEKYGVEDVNILTQNLNYKDTPMTKDETTGIWKTDFQLDANDIVDNVQLVEVDENNKIIKYDCNEYRIIDLCDDEFEVKMLQL